MKAFEQVKRFVQLAVAPQVGLFCGAVVGWRFCRIFSGDRVIIFILQVSCQVDLGYRSAWLVKSNLSSLDFNVGNDALGLDGAAERRLNYECPFLSELLS